MWWITMADNKVEEHTSEIIIKILLFWNQFKILMKIDYKRFPNQNTKNK